VACATANHYFDTTKAGTTFTTKNTDCCSAKANCGGHTCAAGTKSKTNAATIYCTGASATCTNTLCCDNDATKCGGVTAVACTYGNTWFYWDSAKAGTTFTAATKAIDCCTMKGTCSSAYPISTGSSGSTGTGGTTGGGTTGGGNGTAGSGGSSGTKSSSGSQKVQPTLHMIIGAVAVAILTFS
jgi:hypothetical protein